MREHHEEEEQQQLQHTYLSKNLSNNRFASKISSIKQNKTKNRKKKKNTINLKFAEQRQRAKHQARRIRRAKSDNNKN